MTTTAIIGLFTAFLLITTTIVAIIAVVCLLSHPSRRAASSAAELDPVATDTSAPSPTFTAILSQLDTAPALPYTSIPHLLTPAEGDFFAALQAAAPAGMLIFAQVRLANLVQVQPWARRDKTHWYKIQAKCVDFVFCEPRTFVPRLVIELDDSSHNRPDRRERDVFVDDVLAAAGLPILHVRWQRRYDPRDLAQQIAIKLPSAPPAEPPKVPILASAPAIAAAPLPISPTTSTSIRRACGQCQALLGEHSKFCAHCGAQFTHA